MRPGELDNDIAKGTLPKDLKMQIIEVGYANDWTWKKTMTSKQQGYQELLEHIRAQGWKAELKCLILGARGCVYQHTWDILKWIGIKGKEEQNTIA